MMMIILVFTILVIEAEGTAGAIVVENAGIALLPAKPIAGTIQYKNRLNLQSLYSMRT